MKTFEDHVNSNDESSISDEIYTGRTSISKLLEQTELLEQLEQTDHSDRSAPDSHEYISPRRWDPPSNLQATSKMFYNNHDKVNDSSSSSPISLPSAGSHNYANSKTNTKSLYSFTDMENSLEQMELKSNEEPFLGPSTLNYMRDVKSLKLHLEPQVAFETWYAAKQRQRQHQLQLQKEKQEQEQLKKQQRKQLAQLCYEQWLRDKTRLAEERRLNNHMQLAALRAESSLKSVKRKPSIKSERSVTQAEIRNVVQSWWLKKQQQQQRQREETQFYLRKKRREDQRRKQLADQAFQNWIGNVCGKPKPVPMNQGMDSLRATISPIYVNPLRWEPLKNVSKQDR